MQDIYICIPETNHVPREHRVAAILVLLFMVLISLVPALTPFYLYVSTFRSMCAVPNMAVFCSSVTSWFPGMLLTYFLNDFEMVPFAIIITGITFVFTFHMRFISIARYLLIYYHHHHHHHLLQLSFYSVTVVFTLVQTKQIRLNIRKRNNTKNTVQAIQYNTIHSKYKYTYC